MIVVGILSLLAALLLPVLARARERGRQTLCASNLRSIGGALALYRGDHDDRLSPWESGEGRPFVSRLPEIVAPYAKAREILRCPDDHYEPVPGYPAGGTYFERVGASYGYNQRLIARGDEPLADPSRTLLSSEFIPFHGVPLPNGAINGVCLDGRIVRILWSDRMVWLEPPLAR